MRSRAPKWRARSRSAASKWRCSNRTAARTERSKTACRAGTSRCARRSTRRSASELSLPNVSFVPHTEIGRDVGFRELTDEWGFTGVVLACGAWRDRPLPIEGADAYEGRGLIYQNPFIIWFNHSDEPGYDGPVFEPRDGALVVGGGLASIDVVKVLMLETTRAKLRERGIEVDLVEMEVKGIPKTLERHGLAFEDLGLEGCTLFYRRSESGHAADGDARGRRREATREGVRGAPEDAREGDGEVPLQVRAAAACPMD